MKAFWENYWYHYKGVTLAAIFALAVLAIGLKSCSDKTEPDLKVVYFSDSYISADNADIMEKDLREKKLIKDTDGDGHELFYMDIILHDFDIDGTADEATISKIQTMMYAGDHTIVFAHRYALEDYPGFFEDISDKAAENAETFTDAETGYITGISLRGNTLLEKYGMDTENLYLAMRRRTEKEIENGETDASFAAAYDVADYVLSFNEVKE